MPPFSSVVTANSYLSKKTEASVKITGGVSGKDD